MHVIYQVSQNLVLQVEFSPDTLRSACSHVKGKSSLASYSYWRKHIASRLGHGDLISSHSFLDLLSLWCDTTFRTRAKIK